MTCYIFLSRQLVASSGKAAHYQQFINFPTPNEITNAKYRFSQIGRLPGVIGTIDCTHLTYAFQVDQTLQKSERIFFCQCTIKLSVAMT